MVRSLAAARRAASRPGGSDVVTDVAASLPGGLDFSAIRPGAGRSRPSPRAAASRRIWTAALALSLGLHAAAFVAILVWPSPPELETPPDAIPVDIVVEEAAKDAPPPSSLEPTPPDAPPKELPPAPEPPPPQTESAAAPAAPPPAPTEAVEPAPPAEPPANPVEPSPAPQEALQAAAPVEPAPPPKEIPSQQAEPAPDLAQPPANPVEPSPALQEAVPATTSPAAPVESTPAPKETASQQVESAPDVTEPPRAAPLAKTPPALDLPAPPAGRPRAPPVAAPSRSTQTRPLRSKPGPEPTHVAAYAPVAPKAAAPVVSAAVLAEYQRTVTARLSAVKRYPDAARERAPQGVAVVSFSISEFGEVAGVSISRSAGDAMLDAEALATVRRASPFPAPPAGAPRAFSAPLSFKVR